MKIGQHQIGRAKVIARRDEDRGLSRERLDGAVGGGAFNEAQRGRADRHDAPAGAARRDTIAATNALRRPPE